MKRSSIITEIRARTTRLPRSPPNGFTIPMAALVASLLSSGILDPDVRFQHCTASFKAALLLSIDRVTAYAGTHGLHTFGRLVVVETGKPLLNNKHTLCCIEGAPRLITEDQPARGLQHPLQTRIMHESWHKVLLQEIQGANTRCYHVLLTEPVAGMAWISVGSAGSDGGS